MADDSPPASAGIAPVTDASRPRQRIVLGKASKGGVAPDDKNASNATCHVCGERGHCAGFLGAIYQDCVSTKMACYLCKRQGHTTQVCPYRIKPTDLNAEPERHLVDDIASALTGKWRRRSTVSLAREIGGGLAAPPWECSRAFQRCVPTRYAADRYRWRVDSAVLRLHSRRISVLTFHPYHQDRLVAADKSGEISTWNFVSKQDRSVWTGAHKWLINAVSFVSPMQPNTALTASADGTVRLLDLETRHSELLADLNPTGWTGVESQWRMFYAASCPTASGGSGPLLAGDDIGRIWALDPRSPGKVIGHVQAHKRGSKVQCIAHNPAAPELVASAGNDWTVKLWDVRSMSWERDTSLFTTAERPSAGPNDWGTQSSSDGGAAAPSSLGAPTSAADEDDEDGGDAPPVAAASSSSPAARAAPARRGAKKEKEAHCLATIRHPRVVNACAFSPHSGSKLLTTCIDNRLRVWSDLHALAGQQDGQDAAPAPSVEIVHSHDFARYLSPFKAVWDPKDPLERTVVCGRYISEAFPFAGGESLALHPIDVIDIGPARAHISGGDAAVAGVKVRMQLVDPLLPTISPIVAVHPSIDAIACGSSRSVYLWRPVQVRQRAASAAAASTAAAGAPSTSSQPSSAFDGLFDAHSDDHGDGDDDDEDGDYDDGRDSRGGVRGGGAASRPGVKRPRDGAAPDGALSPYFSPGKGRGRGKDAAASSKLTKPKLIKAKGAGSGGSVLSPADIAALARQRTVMLLQGPRDGAGAGDDSDASDDDEGGAPFGSKSSKKKKQTSSGNKDTDRKK